MHETGWLVGIDGGWPERSFAERPGLNFRAAVGDDGGTERSDSGATAFRILDLGWLVGVDDGTRAER